MFGRKQQDEVPAAPEPAVPARAGAKNRPTPTRREAQAARRQPLVPTDRKAAKQASRLKEREARAKQREAMMNGEEWALLPRDRGPEKAFIRDHIDSRWNVGEFLLPVILIGMPLTLIRSSVTVMLGMLLVYGAFLAMFVDLTISKFQLNKRYEAKFGVKPPKGTMWTVAARSLQMRRTRVPRPRVNRGQRPR